MRLRVDLLDGVRVAIADRPVAIASAKARALLACLLMANGGEESREVLAERLWSRSPSAEHQRNSLKRDLKILVDLFRRHGFEGLRGQRHAIRLDLSATDSDLFEVMRSAQRGFAHRLLLEGDRPLAGLAADCSDVDPAFSAWLGERIRFLTEALSRALDRALAEPGHEAQDRIDLARAAFNLDRTRQPAAMVLMRALADAGDLPGALKVYGAFYRAYLQEFDDPPAGEIVALVEELKLGHGREAAGDGAPPRTDRARPLPVRLGLDAAEPPAGPGQRRLALAVIDALGRRPALVAPTAGQDAETVLRILGDGGEGLYLQLWHRPEERLIWSEHLPAGGTDAAESVARRIASVAAGRPLEAGGPIRAPLPGPAAMPETFALRLLLSRPDDPVRLPQMLPDGAQTPDGAARADLGWLALMRGQRREAAAHLRAAAALEPAGLEVAGAAALGLALLGHADEALWLAERLAARPGDPGLRALRGTTLAVCGERRLALLCLSDLPESWILPCGFSAVMAELAGDRAAALALIAPSLARLSVDADSFCAWAVRTLPLPEGAEPMMLRDRLNRLVADGRRILIPPG
ncbi:MAG: hypothetical protein D6686_02395 [Alphaproteobacteria bacterium]|nr:MAG: hypothetical protein D6686_02395 [Alphaproteobacteria bacterium]